MAKMNDKPKRKNSIKNDPFLQGHPTLEFDGLTEDDTLALTEDDAALLFLSSWKEKYHPFTTYKRYFKSSQFKEDIILREIKQGYIKFVIEEEWEELKYELVLDSIFVTNKSLSYLTIERQGELYEKEQLPMQIQEKRRRRRR